MDLTHSSEDIDFRNEVRAFLDAEFPQELAEKARTETRFKRDDYILWQKILAKKGWIAPHWPKEYGGCGWTPVQLNIFDEELTGVGAPRVMPFGIRLVGPVIYTYGTDAQKAKYLPRILSSDDFWCQGFSEPGAGSDLASLRTSAVREGDEYVVNGQKIWTSYAQYADLIFCLVRTDPDAKKQLGISFLLIDMKSPGVSVRPIHTLDGSHIVNEVFLENVRVPVENLVGEENKGWDYAKFLLSNERTGIAGIGMIKADLALLHKIALTERRNGKPLIEDPLFQARLARLEINRRALELTNLRMLTTGGDSGMFPSILKIKGSQLQQRSVELQMEAVGPYALPWQSDAMEPSWNGTPVGPQHVRARAPTYFDRRKTTVYGGSTEVQKNIISKTLLGS
ncbi:acyl-CoA dehydrogenase family protein [Sulfitobacter sp. F26169L]|uniref:acyl-CoA dehydrogenase family protein n=1 Tax=Sulfitobacter sp. F26169L TaxID=2996015 RepID=UPI002260972F|nr:acyl-CoA dehydrogenase family protein [Sulfitobacter sp. F26169L]MCX7568114.1 acyl-CoA dehydrogenase family protein [Sulfitobacter sp. F26169L]